MTITMDKKYKTRSGNPVRILCVDMKGTYPVVGIVEYPQTSALSCWTASGEYTRRRAGQASDYDLIEVKPERVVYYNTYFGGNPGLGHGWTSIELCKRNRDDKYTLIGITKITMVEGEHPRYEFIPE